MSRGVTKLDITDKLRWLGAVYKMPDDLTAAVDVWHEVTRGISYEHFDQALGRFVRDNTSGYFPKPAQIRKLALEVAGKDPKTRPTDLKSRYLRWESHQEGPCPVCGSVMQTLTAERAERIGRPGAGGRIFVVHDAERHRQEGVPHVGPPYWQPKPAEEEAGAARS